MSKLSLEVTSLSNDVTLKTHENVKLNDLKPIEENSKAETVISC